jgi:hypothetical protein
MGTYAQAPFSGLTPNTGWRNDVGKYLLSRKNTMSEKALSMSVPQAGKKYFGLSRNGSYEAAARGEIPTIKVGRLLRVPVRAMEAKFDAVADRAKSEVAA